MALSHGRPDRPRRAPVRLTTEPPEPRLPRRPDPEIPLSPTLPPEPEPPEPPHRLPPAAGGSASAWTVR